MRSRIYNGIARIVMRKIIRLLPRVKRKLQHLHSGISRPLHKPDHRRCKETEILCYDLLLSKLLFHHSEYIITRSLDPLSVSGVLCRIGYTEKLIKAPEMVNAYYIVHVKTAFQSLHPPGITAFLMNLPVIQRIPPKLSVRRKGIRGAACDRYRP